MTSLFGVLSAFGLASAAGLNAYIPLLMVGLAARYTNLIALQAPFDVLASPGALVILAVLAAVEFVADKIPAVDHAWHLAGAVIHPAAGAILFASQQNIIGDVHPLLALVCGLLLAGGVHGARAAVRPLATATTAGVANPVLSFVEDAVAVIWTLLAILVPVIGFVLIGLTAWLAYRAYRRLARTPAPRAQE
jgi:hypothetical protein